MNDLLVHEEARRPGRAERGVRVVVVAVGIGLWLGSQAVSYTHLTLPTKA